MLTAVTWKGIHKLLKQIRRTNVSPLESVHFRKAIQLPPPCQQFVNRCHSLVPCPANILLPEFFWCRPKLHTEHLLSFVIYSLSISSTLFLSHREKEKKMLEQTCLLKLYCFWWQDDRTTDNVGGRRKYKYLPVKQMQLHFSGGFISMGRTKIPLWVPYYLFRQIKGLFHLASNTVGAISDHEQCWWMSSENSFPGEAGHVLSGALDSAPHSSQHTTLPQGDQRQPIHIR